MNKKLWNWALISGTSLIVLFLIKHFWADRPRADNPRFVFNNGNQSSRFEWSEDGRLVKVVPASIYWSHLYFDARTGLKLSLEEGERRLKSIEEPKYYLKSNHDRFRPYGGEIPLFKKSAVSICATGGNKCQLLPETPSKYFKIDTEGFPAIRYQFSSSQISTDNRQVAIVGGDHLKIWRTSDGKLLRRVKLVPTDRILKSVISADLNSVLIILKTSELSPDGRALFVDATGIKRTVTLPETRAYDVGFSSNSNMVWCLGQSDPAGITLTFYNTKTGNALWKCHTKTAIPPVFTRDNRSVLVFGTNGLEIRDINTGAIKHALNGPTNIAFASLSPDGTQFWTNDAQGNISSWRLP